MPTGFSVSDRAAPRGWKSFPVWPSGRFLPDPSHDSRENGVPSLLKDFVQNFSANGVLADSHTQPQAGFYQRRVPYCLSSK